MSVTSNRISVNNIQDTVDPRQVLEEFKTVPFAQWNTRALVAWMEVVVGMWREGEREKEVMWLYVCGEREVGR